VFQEGQWRCAELCAENMCGRKCRWHQVHLRLEVHLGLGIDHVGCSYFTTWSLLFDLGMESPVKTSRTAAHFSQLPTEILLVVASLADPETCLSLLQVYRSPLRTPCSDIDTRLATAFTHSHFTEHFGSASFTDCDSDARYP